MDEKQRFSPPIVGGSSLLVIFAVLCLTVFALLGLTTVRADNRLADGSAEAIDAYYRADNTAETILAQLRDGYQPENVMFHGGIYSYTCPISDTQALSVSVRMIDQDTFTVLRWQAVSTENWQPGTDLDLWNGESYN